MENTSRVICARIVETSFMEEAAPVQTIFIEHFSWIGLWAMHGMGVIEFVFGS